MIIYKIVNLINKKIYIGKDQKNNPNYFGSGIIIRKAIKKYGITNFKKEVLEICTDLHNLNIQEKYWIKKLDSTNKLIGYNIAEGGDGGKTTPVVYNKGKTYEELYGKEKSEKLKKEQRLRVLGTKQTSETIERRNKSLKNLLRTTEWKQNISKSLKGKNLSEQTKNKISNTLKENYKNNPQLGDNLSKKHKGKLLSDTHKKNISIGVKNNKNRKKPTVHQCSRKWTFYNANNEICFEHTGNYNNFCTANKISIRKTKKFDNLELCLQFNNKEYLKVYYTK